MVKEIMLYIEIVFGRTHARTQGRKTDIGDQKSYHESYVLRWALNSVTVDSVSMDFPLLSKHIFHYLRLSRLR